MLRTCWDRKWSVNTVNEALIRTFLANSHNSQMLDIDINQTCGFNMCAASDNDDVYLETDCITSYLLFLSNQILSNQTSDVLDYKL